MADFAGVSGGSVLPGAYDLGYRTWAHGSDLSRKGPESPPNWGERDRTIGAGVAVISGANEERIASAAPRFRVIDGGGRPEQDEQWLRHDIGPEATAARVAIIEAEREAKRQRYEAKWHTIYKLYGADGCLLYVGISVNGLGRLPEHATDKAWWRCVARAEFEHVEGRSAAEARELELIRSLDPVHNVAGKEAS